MNHDEKEAREESTNKVDELVVTLEKIIEDIERKRDQERPHDFLHKKPPKESNEELLMNH